MTERGTRSRKRQEMLHLRTESGNTTTSNAVVGDKPPNRPETTAYNHKKRGAPRSKKPSCPAMSPRSRAASRPSRGLATGVHAGADDSRGKHPFVWWPQPSVARCSDDDPSSF